MHEKCLSDLGVWGRIRGRSLRFLSTLYYMQRGAYTCMGEGVGPDKGVKRVEEGALEFKSPRFANKKTTLLGGFFIGGDGEI